MKTQRENITNMQSHKFNLTVHFYFANQLHWPTWKSNMRDDCILSKNFFQLQRLYLMQLISLRASLIFLAIFKKIFHCFGENAKPFVTNTRCQNNTQSAVVMSVQFSYVFLATCITRKSGNVAGRTNQIQYHAADHLYQRY